MIVKLISNPRQESSKAARIGSLLDYIVADGRLEAHKAEYIGASGSFYSNSGQGERAEMIALAMEASRSKDPVDHWLLSWKEGEQPTHIQCSESVEILKSSLGMSREHLAVYALHKDSANYHLHIVLNRVHPGTMKVKERCWCIDKAHQAVAKIVHAQGWEAEGNARYVADDHGEIVRAENVPTAQPCSRAQDHENATGIKSCERIAVEEAAPILANAKTWEQVHEELARNGMRYERKGSGAVLWVGGQRLKASAIGRDFSRNRMEERLGEFLEAKGDSRILQRPSETEPLRSEMPVGWADYSAALAANRKQKDAAVTEQRMEHGAARDTQTAEFRKERSEQYRGGNWSGNALNVARSLLAGDHARRKAVMMERHKREREHLRKVFGKRKTFEQFLEDRGETELAAEWRYRDNMSLVASIHGNAGGTLAKHDIRDFIARMAANEIQYFSRFDLDHVSFTDRGRRIDVLRTQDEVAVLAALQLGAQKWETLTITGPAEFKQLCGQLAAQHGFKVRNPELCAAVASGLGERRPGPAIPVAMPSLSNAYRMHKADILNRIEVRNPSQLDWMIAVRMRVTGHEQRAIAQALKENAGQGRESENRNWSNYAERTAEAVFGPRGDRESLRSELRADAWARVEGRAPERARPKEPVQRQEEPELEIERERADRDFER